MNGQNGSKSFPAVRAAAMANLETLIKVLGSCPEQGETGNAVRSLAVNAAEVMASLSGCDVAEYAAEALPKTRLYEVAVLSMSQVAQATGKPVDEIMATFTRPYSEAEADGLRKAISGRLARCEEAAEANRAPSAADISAMLAKMGVREGERGSKRIGFTPDDKAGE